MCVCVCVCFHVGIWCIYMYVYVCKSYIPLTSRHSKDLTLSGNRRESDSATEVMKERVRGPPPFDGEGAQRHIVSSSCHCDCR